jgi:type I restriction enzyme S subunit
LKHLWIPTNDNLPHLYVDTSAFAKHWLNSAVGQMQAERDAGGSIIMHWKPEEIRKVIIPILPKETRQKIAELVRQSHDSRKKAKQLLEEAKHKVEEMIENQST